MKTLAVAMNRHLLGKSFRSRPNPPRFRLWKAFLVDHSDHASPNNGLKHLSTSFLDAKLEVLKLTSIPAVAILRPLPVDIRCPVLIKNMQQAPCNPTVPLSSSLPPSLNISASAFSIGHLLPDGFVKALEAGKRRTRRRSPTSLWPDLLNVRLRFGFCRCPIEIIPVLKSVSDRPHCLHLAMLGQIAVRGARKFHKLDHVTCWQPVCRQRNH